MSILGFKIAFSVRSMKDGNVMFNDLMSNVAGFPFYLIDVGLIDDMV